MKHEPTTENHVKDIVRQWCDKHGAYHFAVVQSGMGVHGIHDRLMALPVTVTPEMVGKKIGLFVALECKKPGRRGEPDRGMSKHQVLFMEGVKKAGGLSFCVDGHEDLLGIQATLQQLTGDSNG
jgi:ribosomal protein S19